MVISNRSTSNNGSNRVVFFTIAMVVMILLGFLASMNVDTSLTTNQQYRMKITINNTGSSDNLINFPLAVHLNSSLTNFWNHVNFNHSDIRFIDDDGHTELYFEVEQWDYGTRTAYIWVNVTQIDAGSINDYIYLYYGNHTASSSLYESPIDVWDNHYWGVWHLNEEFGIIRDSTRNHYDGTPSGNPAYGTQGAINGGMTLYGNGDYVDYGNIYSDLHGGKTLTMEAWFTLENLTTNQVILGKNNGTTLPFGTQIYASSNQIAVIGGDTSDGYKSHTFSWIPDTNWHYLVGVINGSTIQGYLDGVDMGTTTRNDENILNNTASFIIGWQNITGFGRDFNGTLDEIRISNLPLSPSWINATFKNIGTSYISFGDEEDVAPPDISHIHDYPDPQLVNGYVNITCEVTDNEIINMTKIHITYPDTSLVNMTMNPIPLTDTYYYNSTYVLIGVYSYYIWANDTDGNGEKSPVFTFTIEAPVASINVEKTVKNDSHWVDNITAFLGDDLEFKIVVTNTGTAVLTGVEIIDVLPLSLRYNYDGIPNPAMESYNQIKWNLGSITPGDSIVVTYSAHVIASGFGNNEAFADCHEGVNDTDMVSLTCVMNGDDTTPPLVSLDKPSRYLYIADRAILPTLWRPIILGGVTIEAIAMDDESGIDRVEFLVGNDIKNVDETWPYEWYWDELSFGLYTLKAKAYNTRGDSDIDSLSIYIINF